MLKSSKANKIQGKITDKVYMMIENGLS